MSFIHIMSLKPIKTTQKCLIFWNLLGALTNKVLIKNSKFILHSLYFLEVFKTTKNCLLFSNLLVVLINKSAHKKLKQQELNASICFRDYKMGQQEDCKSGQVLRTTNRARGITNRGSLRDFKSGQKDYKSEQGF